MDGFSTCLHAYTWMCFGTGTVTVCYTECYSIVGVMQAACNACGWASMFDDHYEMVRG